MLVMQPVAGVAAGTIALVAAEVAAGTIAAAEIAAGKIAAAEVAAGTIAAAGVAAGTIAAAAAEVAATAVEHLVGVQTLTVVDDEK